MVNMETNTYNNSIIASGYNVTFDLYKDKNIYFHQEGWKQSRSIEKRQKKLLHLVKQTNIRSYRTAPR